MENPAFRKSTGADVITNPISPVIVVDEMALRRSVIFNEGRLKHEEKLFLDMVQSGDILNLRDLLSVSDSVFFYALSLRTVFTPIRVDRSPPAVSH